MAEASDSPEVQAFMAAFQKLRNLIDDKPEILDDEFVENVSLANSCQQLNEAAHRIRASERSRGNCFQRRRTRRLLKSGGITKRDIAIRSDELLHGSLFANYSATLR